MGPRACLDRCGKSRPPPVFDPQTVQLVASRYTDYATLPTVRLSKPTEISDSISSYLAEYKFVCVCVCVCVLSVLFIDFNIGPRRRKLSKILCSIISEGLRQQSFFLLYLKRKI